MRITLTPEQSQRWEEGGGLLRRVGAAASAAREGWPSAGDARRGSGVKMPFKLPILSSTPVEGGRVPAYLRSGS